MKYRLLLLCLFATCWSVSSASAQSRWERCRQHCAEVRDYCISHDRHSEHECERRMFECRRDDGCAG